jgi:hypothetical protein
VVQAVQGAEFGPLAPYGSTPARGHVDDQAGMKNGLIRRGPFSSSTSCIALDQGKAADAGADHDARRARRSPPTSKPESSSANLAAASANWMKGRSS